MVAQVEQLAMGERTIKAMLVDGGESSPVLVPNDGSVLPKSIAIRLGEGDDGSPLPVIDMRPGLIVFFGVRGRDGREVSVCMRDLFFGQFRLYPGMVPFHGLTVSFFLIGAVFLNSIILVLTLSYPPDSSAYQIISGLGTVAGKALDSRPMNYVTTTLYACEVYSKCSNEVALTVIHKITS